ncbi:MAG TPA: hypothetical protein VGJ86_12800 [Acidimicrobiales bacterium]|jgi:hypothetical protein
MDELKAIQRGVDTIAAIDPDTLDEDELNAGLGELRRLLNKLIAIEAQLLADFDRRQLWKHDGSTSLVAWLTRHLRPSPPAPPAQTQRQVRLPPSPAGASPATAPEGRDPHSRPNSPVALTT